MHLPKVRRRTFSWIRSPCFLSNLWHILNVAFGVATNLSSSDYTRENAFNAMHSKRTLINATASLNRKKPNLHVKSRKKFAAKVSNSVNIHNYFLFVQSHHNISGDKDKTRHSFRACTDRRTTIPRGLLRQIDLKGLRDQLFPTTPQRDRHIGRADSLALTNIGHHRSIIHQVREIFVTKQPVNIHVLCLYVNK